MNETTQKLGITLAAVFALGIGMSTALAAAPGYVEAPAANAIVRSGFGLCWHTGYWTPAMAIEECDPDLVPKKAEPAPAPAAPAAAPAPAPKAAPAPEPAAAPAPEPAAAPAPEPAAAPQEPVYSPPPPPAAAAPVAPAAAPAAAKPVSEKVTMSADAHFDFDKAVLKPEGKAKLDDLVGKLQAVNLEVIIAVGHTDSIGTEAYNMKLSMRRANAVKDYLVSKGIDANRIHTEGKGESQPIASNKTKEGRAKNRRVEIEVVGSRGR